MTKEQFKHIESYIEEYDQNNPAPLYTPVKDDENYVYIFGECFGFVLIPETDGRVTFTYLVEDDGQWFMTKEDIYADSSWIPDIIKCLNIAQEYLTQNATPVYFKNTDTQCGYKLPYKN